MLATSQRERRDLVLRLELEYTLHVGDDFKSPRGIDTLLANGAAFGVVAFNLFFVDRHASLREPPVARLPDPVRGVVLPFPSIGSLDDEAPSMYFYVDLPVTMCIDGVGRPFATIDCEKAIDDVDLRKRIDGARAVRSARDEALAVATAAKGDVRIVALQRALETMDRWLVLRCYAAELAELDASSVPAAVEYARPLLREHRVLRACGDLREASVEMKSIAPRRLRKQLDAVVRTFSDLPEVAVLAHCVQGSAELRLALHEADRDRVVERVRSATAASEPGLVWVQQLAKLWVWTASRWQPR
ncbi:MAG: hypothetical protein JNK15_09315 [Planctomycetes bacterium]|nr:hypothetical protein [Planctomycetota bacterium]